MPLGASLRVALRFPQEEDLKQVFSPLIYGPDLRQSLLVCELHNPLGAVNFVNVDCIVFLNILRLGKRLTRFCVFANEFLVAVIKESCDDRHVSQCKSDA